MLVAQAHDRMVAHSDTTVNVVKWHRTSDPRLPQPDARRVKILERRCFGNQVLVARQ